MRSDDLPSYSHSGDTVPVSSLPPMIAVVGCDGSGKSTLTELLGLWLAEFRPTTVCHLGKQSGNIGRALARIPLLGPKLEHSIYKKAKKAQTEKGPSLLTAVGIYAFTIRRVRRFHRMMRLRKAGNTIIADRFPQVEVPGPMDGPGLGHAQPNGVIGWLARRERRKLEGLAACLPDLVIRLNVSLKVAQARKPDHRPSSLARKIEDLSRLTFQGAPILELNADAPLETVVAEAKAAIVKLLEARYGPMIPMAPGSR
jgi:thymidylate kinase